MLSEVSGLLNGSTQHLDRLLLFKKHNFVTYQVSWWNGQQRETGWLSTDEIKYDPQNVSVLKIGYT